MSPTLSWIISLGIAVCCGWLGNYLYYNVFLSPPPPVEGPKPEGLEDWVVVDIEDALPEGLKAPSGIDRILVPPDVDPRSYLESHKMDPAEAERLANWKANFPYKPTTDPDVVIPEGGAAWFPIRRNHGYMRHFFENETRFTAQFQQLYRILEEHGRADNPMATGDIFECLREYQKRRQKDPDEIKRSSFTREGRHSTYGELAEDDKESILATLQSEKMWPVLGGMPGDEAVALRDRIITEIQGVDKLPDATKDVFLINGDYGDELEAGDSPLVISPGWQAAYDKWDRERNRMKVDKNNVLLAGGKPVLYDENRNVAGIITPDGYEVPLHLDEDGKVIVPTPAEIDEMIANGEGKYVGHRPAPQLDEDWKMEALQRVLREASNRQEWKMQEAQRMLEEAARQQE